MNRRRREVDGFKKTTNMLNREELFELEAVIKRTLQEQMEMYEEVWLTDKELCKYFGTLKPAWLDRYWTAFPKGCVKQPGVKDEKGVVHTTSRLYARNKIQRLFASGEIEKLACKAVVTIQ